MIELLVKSFYLTLPLMFALSVSGEFDVHTSRLAVLGIFVLYVGHGLYQRNLFIPRGSIVFIAASLLVWTFCSLLYTEVAPWTARKIFYLLTFAPLCVVSIWCLMRGGDSEKNLVKAVVIGGLIGSAVAIIQFCLQFIIGLESLEKLWSTLTPLFLGGAFSQSVASFNSWFVHVGNTDVFRAIGFFPDPHVFAFYTGMIAPFAYGLYVQSHKKLWLVIGLIITLANLLSFSRGGEMGLMVGLLVGIVISWPHLSLAKKHIATALCAMLILIAIVPGNAISERFVSSFSTKDTSNTSRVEIWSEAAEMIAQSPLLGVGLGAYAYTLDPTAPYRTPAYAHNVFLDVGAELGLIGLMLFVMLLIRMTWVFAAAGTVISYCAIISMSIFLTHGLFDTPFFSVHVFPLILFLIALAAYYECISQKKRPT